MPGPFSGLFAEAPVVETAPHEREAAAQACAKHLRELEAMEALGKSVNARIYIGFKKHDGDD
ncbi:MAG: hypothetical protein HXY28_11115 [Hydrogenophilaceae bacterium]|nr:hypothetical protein [Hydrogenophilaceae bacterium]